MTTHALGEVLRQVMRRVPSPVTVVTAAADGEMRGITIGSFTSVSLEPPLISFNVARRARMHPLLLQARYFAVHILGAEQVALSQRFAEPGLSGQEQFEGLAYQLHAEGTPVLEGVLAVLHCRPYRRLEAGDHTIFVGEVMEIEVREEGPPLLYYNRTYRAVGETLVPSLLLSSAAPKSAKS
ncbi:flavin reductase family protein [Rhodothermus profundi]|uniref:NADH-FMN oxidoreductase RutF, flavin reductase (DIM6/NTAB) family n=1 Tax=Rhodothermus profundi TaxID=633813 RepID=A0A1M6TGV9_9BACT|nr:flavin reductase family protein [Rhodothermus profundi]SHK56134.1 NADH-FMN oxidoreductase RutF, flavin reductase (DIM6/NTAB) family [Rhodothermus profundi]